MCRKYFPFHSILALHLRANPGLQAFQYPHCGHRAAQRALLSSHLRSHQQEHPLSPAAWLLLELEERTLLREDSGEPEAQGPCSAALPRRAWHLICLPLPFLQRQVLHLSGAGTPPANPSQALEVQLVQFWFQPGGGVAAPQSDGYRASERPLVVTATPEPQPPEQQEPRSTWSLSLYLGQRLNVRQTLPQLLHLRRSPLAHQSSVVRCPGFSRVT